MSSARGGVCTRSAFGRRAWGIAHPAPDTVLRTRGAAHGIQWAALAEPLGATRTVRVRLRAAGVFGWRGVRVGVSCLAAPKTRTGRPSRVIPVTLEVDLDSGGVRVAGVFGATPLVGAWRLPEPGDEIELILRRSGPPPAGARTLFLALIVPGAGVRAFVRVAEFAPGWVWSDAGIIVAPGYIGSSITRLAAPDGVARAHWLLRVTRLVHEDRAGVARCARRAGSAPALTDWLTSTAPEGFVVCVAALLARAV